MLFSTTYLLAAESELKMSLSATSIPSVANLFLSDGIDSLEELVTKRYGRQEFLSLK